MNRLLDCILKVYLSVKVSIILQIITILQLACTVLFVAILQTCLMAEDTKLTWRSGTDTFGYLGFTLLLSFKLIPCLSLPFTLMNIIALIFTNVWPEKPQLEVPTADIPFMCFRVVTRGFYKNLLINNLQRNIEICQRVGLEKFKFEVVTDISLDLNPSMFVRERVVPNTYVTNNNSLYKARALHYCLDKDADIISSNDWIVHLDEETVLTEGSVIGLANFTTKELGSIGQGVITYANDGIMNWFTTLADSVRVSIDVGLMKFCFQKLHRPVYGLKGSFIVVNASVEKAIGFDFGPEGSIAEDLYFALKAWENGYKFNFVEGEMWEKSPFTIEDYIRQRRRWFVGRMFTLLSPNIPIQYKLLLIPSDLGWLLLMLNILNIPLSYIFRTKTPYFLMYVNSIIGGLIMFLYIFGSIKSFSIKRYGLKQKVILCIWTVVIIPLAACLDGAASMCGLFSRIDEGFYIVKKDHEMHKNTSPEQI